MKSFGQKIQDFNKSLKLDRGVLPIDVDVLNPFQGENSSVVNTIAEQFYGRFYNDQLSRRLILGINPGRLGAGSTGIPFTDTKRLDEYCSIKVDFRLHEPSSVFVYEVIEAYGGPVSFYQDFYIGSVCPLGFVKRNKKGSWVNYNYYDDAELQKAVTPFIIKSIKEQIRFGLNTDKVFCLGTGKNFKFLKQLNKDHRLFDQIVPLEHPRYIMQYKNKSKEVYCDKYIELLVNQ